MKSFLIIVITSLFISTPSQAGILSDVFRKKLTDHQAEMKFSERQSSFKKKIESLRGTQDFISVNEKKTVGHVVAELPEGIVYLATLFIADGLFDNQLSSVASTKRYDNQCLLELNDKAIEYVYKRRVGNSDGGTIGVFERKLVDKRIGCQGQTFFINLARALKLIDESVIWPYSERTIKKIENFYKNNSGKIQVRLTGVTINPKSHSGSVSGLSVRVFRKPVFGLWNYRILDTSIQQ